MNSVEYDVLDFLLQHPYVGQRHLSAMCGHSLGAVNSALKQLTTAGYLDKDFQPTQKAKLLAAEAVPKNAVILAAGFGMRMVPINTEMSKALLEVRGEVLIERTIRQLQETGIRNIRIVVGFMKESFEYLIDTYGVELVVNPLYATKNNLHSLAKVLPQLGNSYIIPCDIWCAENPYRSREFYSWYMVTDEMTKKSTVRVNRQRELVAAGSQSKGHRMVGICYLTETDAAALKKNITALCRDSRYDNAFWEDGLFGKNAIPIHANVVPARKAVEIDTYEQLRELDKDSNSLQTSAITVIARVLQVDPNEIHHIKVLKKGMTNRSFLFRCRDKKYIMRIPGEGTDRLINRVQEAAVYSAIDNKGICDDVLYIDPSNGYKITEFLEDARVCDPAGPEDVKTCMARLRQFHDLQLQVAHSFDIFRELEFYEGLWNGIPSCYRDYQKTKEQVLSLKSYIDKQEKQWCLTHIDAVPDNFLFTGEELRLIDWEYAGMQDPHVDIAMFGIYAMYDQRQMDALIDAYFPEGCPETTRTKIYCYIAACGLLWSNWCECKRQHGVDFGEYSLRQYRFAKEYYKLAAARIAKGDG